MEKKSPRSKNRIEGNKYYVRLYAQTILKRREIFMCKENSTNISLLLNKNKQKQRKACGKCVRSGKENIPPKMCY